MKKIKCVMIGQTYAEKSIKLFLEAISELNAKKSEEINITLDYYGNSLLNEFEILDREKELVKIMGWIDSVQLSKKIQHYNFALLPYFEDDNKIVGEMSFPSKIIFYCKAEIPVLYIGNKNSHAAKIIMEYEIGKVVGQNEMTDKEFMTNMVELQDLKEKGNYKNNIKIVNSKIFSRKAFIDTLSEIKQFEKIQVKNHIREIGASNNIKNLYENDLHGNLTGDSTKYSDNYIAILNYFKFFDGAKSLGTSRLTQIISKPVFHENNKIEIVKIQLSHNGKSKNISNLFLESASRDKIKKFVSVDQTSQSQIIFSDARAFSVKNFYENSLPLVVKTINPERSNKVIFVKKFKKTQKSVKTKKIRFKQFLEISDFYLLSLLGNYVYIFGQTKKSEILSTIAEKIKFEKINFKDFMFILHENIDEYHVHDPQIYKSFNIAVRNTYSLFELNEIYESVIKLDQKNLGARFDGMRSLKRFIGFLYILDLDSNGIQNLLSNLVKIDRARLWNLIIEMKPERNIKYPKLNRITKKIKKLFSIFRSEKGNDIEDMENSKKRKLIYNI